MANKIAVIMVQPGTQEIISVTFSKTSLRFKCQRCAVFCCKCGGPRLLPKDVANLERSGNHSVHSANLSSLTMRNKAGGSCIFLKQDSKQIFSCGVYDFRPTLCRTYPFKFERTGDNLFSMNLIPCCNGLNAPDGEVVDMHFFAKNLKKPFLDLLEHGQL